jgi:hypothetical protein
MYNDAERADYLPTLKEYLGELSKLSHSEAQKSRATGDYLKAPTTTNSSLLRSQTDPGVADNLFLLGEVYTEAGERRARSPRISASFTNIRRTNAPTRRVTPRSSVSTKC